MTSEQIPKSGITVLSLFDGISGGKLALERAGTPVERYFASEIDKYAIQISKKNHSDIIHVGDVRKVRYDADSCMLHTENGSYYVRKIHLILGGSPCQGFSMAGGRLNFDDPRSQLYFEYERLLSECTPTWFLLENVRMNKESRDVITRNLGVEPVLINSSVFSAQHRERYYWTNIPIGDLPEDKGLTIKDVLSPESAIGLPRRPLAKLHEKSTRRDNGCKRVGSADIRGRDITRRVYSMSGKCPTLTTMQGGHRHPKITEDKKTWRRLSPLECERLQTLPDNYTEGVSDTQRYKAVGNGWTIDVVAHILSNIKRRVIL